MDEDGGGDVDFQEFVSGLSAFSSKGNKEQKLSFAFKVYDIDRDGFISNGELFIVLKMMVGNNLKDQQLQQIVDKTIMEADLDGDGKINFDEFTKMVENTDVSMSMTLGMFESESCVRGDADNGRPVLVFRGTDGGKRRYRRPYTVECLVAHDYGLGLILLPHPFTCRLPGCVSPPPCRRALVGDTSRKTISCRTRESRRLE